MTHIIDLIFFSIFDKGAAFRLGTAPHLDFTRMADTYGDVFSIKIGTRLVVVLNRHKIIREALMKKAAVFAGRPDLYTFSIASGGGGGMTFVDYSPKQQALRKLTQNAIHKYLTTQEMLEKNIQAECKRLLEYFKKQQGKPFEPRDIFKMATSNIILGILFGTNFSYDNKELQTLLHNADDFKECLSVGNQIDFMPWLSMFTNSCFVKLSRLFKIFRELINKLFLENKLTYVDGKTRNFADTLIKAHMDNKRIAQTENTKYELRDNDLLWTLADLFGAAMDTSAVTLTFALGYLLKYPVYQAEIQAEIDSLLDHKEAIKTEQVEKLHFLQAFLYEIFRITSIVPTSLPHSTTADTTLVGYHIPKGTVILPNLWSVHHDPNVWKDPHLFNPRRFLDEKNQVIDTNTLAGFMPFSLGRRMCPGYKLGILQICMFLSALLQRFNFTQDGLDAKFKILDLTPEYGVSMKPSTFYLNVHERNEE